MTTKSKQMSQAQGHCPQSFMERKSFLHGVQLIAPSLQQAATVRLVRVEGSRLSEARAKGTQEGTFRVKHHVVLVD